MDMKMEKKMKNFIVNHAFVVKSLLAGGNGKAQLPRRHFVREEFSALSGEKIWASVGAARLL